ncbi:hypothetical protein [Loigolactobacillus bifermentans]|uniref:Uncharacterized protein n=1 Tax=Loigolactobacillus bifermentans DSM 20003 TaxID=1423726 RepID=A0A0R1H7Q5_9LACO|nr:hypothetical protein [Loigolactobacillus bifermentans]KRK39988.1 hypothetical protein FC07_GL001786 [Loigolactobacillus bifermentans DSM 20003]QGG59686.1 hypothetical protein LB003_03855 [Loigolactobacillus bifermentans]
MTSYMNGSIINIDAELAELRKISIPDMQAIQKYLSEMDGIPKMIADMQSLAKGSLVNDKQLVKLVDSSNASVAKSLKSLTETMMTSDGIAKQIQEALQQMDSVSHSWPFYFNKAVEEVPITNNDSKKTIGPVTYAEFVGSETLITEIEYNEIFQKIADQDVNVLASYEVDSYEDYTGFISFSQKTIELIHTLYDHWVILYAFLLQFKTAVEFVLFFRLFGQDLINSIVHLCHLIYLK